MKHPRLLEVFGFESRKKNPRIPRITEVFLIKEDSRRNIINLLGFSENSADFFHNADKKYDFSLAKACRLWMFPDNVGPRKNVEIPYQQFASFMSEMGAKLLRILKKKPALEKEINKATSLKAINDLISKHGSSPPSQEKVFMKFPDGSYWLNLNPGDECAEEGQLMQHCATDHRGGLVSLRDKTDSPHVTMTYNPESNTVYQIKGKQNQEPDKKYHHYIVDFFKKTKAKLKDSFIKTGKGGLYKALEPVLPPKEASDRDQYLVKIKSMLNDPVIRAFPWDLSSALFQATEGGEIDYDETEDAQEYVDELERAFNEAGYEQVQTNWGSPESMPLIHKATWNKKVPLPDIELVKGWVSGLAPAVRKELGGRGSDFVSNPLEFYSKNKNKLDEFDALCGKYIGTSGIYMGDIEDYVTEDCGMIEDINEYVFDYGLSKEQQDDYHKEVKKLGEYPSPPSIPGLAGKPWKEVEQFRDADPRWQKYEKEVEAYTKKVQDLKDQYVEEYYYEQEE